MGDDRESVECCKCHQSMSLDDGCEWGDFERLYCWGCAHDEIDRLRAIVDRLPKTADGVPVLPLDDLWTWFGDGPLETVTMYGLREGGIYTGCYSTREAAENARTA